MPAVAAATCHGYNEWIADMCRDGGGKLSAVGIVPLQSAEAAAREALHIARLGLKGVCFRPERYKGLALYDEALDRSGRPSPTTACSPPSMAASAR